MYGTLLTLSGVESKRLLDTFAEFKVPHIQLSYYYLRRVFSDPKEFENYAPLFNTVFLDHGLIYHKYKSEPEKQEFLEDYLGYIGGLPKGGVYSAVVAHPDIPLDKVVDSSKLIYPLDDLKDLFEGDMKSIFSQVEYIGIGNKTATNEEEMGFIMAQAIKNNTKIHVFGTSSIRVLKKWPIYSANSSSWRTGSRYANTYIYEGVSRGLRIYQPTDKSDLEKTDREKRTIRTRLKNMVQTKQPDLYDKIEWGALLEDDSWEVDKANLTQWMLYQQDLELEPAIKGRPKYFLSESDIQNLKLRKQELLGNSVEAANNESSAGRDNTDEENADLKPRSDIGEDYIGRADIEPDIEPEILELETIESPDIENDNIPPAPSTALAPTLDSEIVKSTARLKEVDARITAPRKCDFCILADRCPKYQAGAACAFGLNDSYDPVEIDDHIAEDVSDLLAIQKDRVLQGYMEEKADASGLNKDLSREMRLYLEMVALRKEAMDTRDSVEIKAKGTGVLQMFQKRPPQ